MGFPYGQNYMIPLSWDKFGMERYCWVSWEIFWGPSIQLHAITWDESQLMSLHIISQHLIPIARGILREGCLPENE